MDVMIAPCFYCPKKAEYLSLDVAKVNDKLEVVEVCKDHFVFPGTS